MLMNLVKTDLAHHLKKTIYKPLIHKASLEEKFLPLYFAGAAVGSVALLYTSMGFDRGENIWS